MPNSIKEQITTDLQQAKESGQLRSERIREIVQSAVAEVATEVKTGSSEMRSLVKDAVAAVMESLREQGGELTEEISASLEGAIAGMSRLRRQAIAKTHTEIQQLQARLDQEESDLQEDINSALVEVKEESQTAPSALKTTLDSVVDSLQDTEEVALMKKRYAQLQAQLAILRANLMERYGGRYEEVKTYLDEAQTWYQQARTQAETVTERVEEQHAQLDEKLGEAGTAVAKGERRLRHLLSELLHTAVERFREQTPTAHK